jgi:predicted membrane protein
MNNRFYYVYLIAGSIALLLFIYQLFSSHNADVNLYNLMGYIIAVIILYYLAYKTYHEKKDKELM